MNIYKDIIMITSFNPLDYPVTLGIIISEEETEAEKGDLSRASAGE